MTDSPEHSTLQRKLMHSLDVLDMHDPKLATEIKNINVALEHVYIPEDDYSNVLGFILLLLHLHPVIMHNSRDQELKELCIECVECLTPEKQDRSSGIRRSY